MHTYKCHLPMQMHSTKPQTHEPKQDSTHSITLLGELELYFLK
uniref:Uncharacterized protein n=1 Tax=Arundo donax TaxID=35708 RepID=A0A0A9CD95_ARUDO